MTRPSDSGASGVDWSGELEAVHEDGRISKVTPTTLASTPYMHYAGRVEGAKWGFAKDGFPLSALCPWRIRNRQPLPADTVTVGRMTEAEAMNYIRDRIAIAPDRFSVGVAVMKALGLIKTDPSPLDRFMAAHPDADRATAEKALAWGEGE